MGIWFACLGHSGAIVREMLSFVCVHVYNHRHTQSQTDTLIQLLGKGEKELNFNG